MLWLLKEVNKCLPSLVGNTEEQDFLLAPNFNLSISMVFPKLTLYKSAILPHLTYCHLVWNFCKSSNSRKIEWVREHALWAIYKSKNEMYEALLARARLPILYNRPLQDIATLMYKVKNNLAPSCLSQLFKTKNSVIAVAANYVNREHNHFILFHSIHIFYSFILVYQLTGIDFS